MRKEIINPFIMAARMAFEKDYNVDLVKKTIIRKDSPVPGLGVAVNIGITGGVRGTVVYSMSEETAYGITERMMVGKTSEAIRKFTPSAVAEMANVITGIVTQILEEEKILCEITPPTVFTGANLGINFPEGETICVTASSELGDLEINIAVTE